MAMPLCGRAHHHQLAGPGLCQRGAVCRKELPRPQAGLKCDLVMSSGFMAFAAHSGFLQAVRDADVDVQGVCGTSSGALAGSLYCAGMTPEQVGKELNRVKPIEILRPCWRPWRGGILSLHKVVERLHSLIPATFEELDQAFAVGVVSARGEYKLITSGALPEAVAASIAIPFIFAAVDIPGQQDCPYKDGGMVDRVGLLGWRQLLERTADVQPASARPSLVHLIARSSRFSGRDDTRVSSAARALVVQSPRSRGGFFSLGDFEGQMQAARLQTAGAVQRLEQQLAQPAVS